MSDRLYREESLWTKDFVDEAKMFMKVAKVGKGTYGYVYKAYLRENPGVYYALKKIKQDKDRDDGFPITALREIQILQKLTHKNIIRLVQNYTSKKAAQNKHRRSTYLVLEYMEHDFHSLLSRVSFSYAEIKCLMLQLLQGIDYLHSQDIIHRDMKTGNLLLNNKGEIKIADFGLARYYSETKYLTDNVVTIWYRAPELLYGNKKYSSKIDMWSIGCIFAELLLKFPIFQGSSPANLVELFYEKLGDPTEDWDEVSNPDIYKLWNEYKPKKRYNKSLRQDIIKHFPSADEVCLDLLEKLLTYNPAKRLNATQAMDHPFFKTKPHPCLPKQIKKLDIEYHDYLIREKEVKAKQEKQAEMMKRELAGTRHDRRENDESRHKKESDIPINVKPKNQPDRLALLFNKQQDKSQVGKLKRIDKKDSDENFDDFATGKKNSFEMTYKNDGFKKRMPEFSSVKDYDPYSSNNDRKKYKR